jgi:diguanylate cyclase (GGDEF)-like protein
MDEHKRLRPTRMSPGAEAHSMRQLFEEAQHNEKVLRRYQEFELALLSAERLDELLVTLLRSSKTIFQLAAVELWLHDPQNSLAELLPEEFASDSALVFHGSDRSFRRLFPEPTTVRLLSTQDGASLPAFRGKGVRSAALLPLYRKGAFVGSMLLGAREAQRFTADKSTDFISHMASVVAVCIENVLAQEQLRLLSLLDPLTKVKNRRGFHLGLETEISRANRSRDPLCLLFVDLDHFKAINDTHGHPAGDRVLQVIAQFLRTALRKVDHVCRYGGEEFALVLPNCGREPAMETAERLRARVSQLEIEIGDEDRTQTITVTLSIGVSCWHPTRRIRDTEQAELASALIRRSDQGVYESKASGRNTVSYVPLHAR